MIIIVLVIHVLIAVALTGVILMQRSEGGALGIGGGGGGVMSSRGAGNLLSRSTAILAVAFFATSILLAIMTGNHGEPESIISAPATEAPAEPTGPTVPLSD